MVLQNDQVSLAGILHTITLPGMGNGEGRLISEQYMLHIVHSPRFSLLAPLTFAVDMSGQMFD